MGVMQGELQAKSEKNMVSEGALGRVWDCEGSVAACCSIANRAMVRILRTWRGLT